MRGYGRWMMLAGVALPGGAAGAQVVTPAPAAATQEPAKRESQVLLESATLFPELPLCPVAPGICRGNRPRHPVHALPQDEGSLFRWGQRLHELFAAGRSAAQKLPLASPGHVIKVPPSHLE